MKQPWKGETCRAATFTLHNSRGHHPHCTVNAQCFIKHNTRNGPWNGQYSCLAEDHSQPPSLRKAMSSFNPRSGVTQNLLTNRPRKLLKSFGAATDSAWPGNTRKLHLGEGRSTLDLHTVVQKIECSRLLSVKGKF